MFRIRKLIALLAALVLVCGSFAACEATTAPTGESNDAGSLTESADDRTNTPSTLPDASMTDPPAETTTDPVQTKEPTEPGPSGGSSVPTETTEPTETPDPVPTPTPAPTLTPYTDPDFGPVPSGVSTVVLEEADLHKGALILIDGAHPFDPASVTGMVNAFEQIRKVSTGNYLRLISTALTADPELVNALVRLQHAMKTELGTEKDLAVRAAYMTAEEIEKASTDTLHAYCPGDDPMGSEHGAGLAANLAFIGAGLTYRVYDGGSGTESAYITRNAPRYGLIVRYTKIKSSLTGHEEEKDHFRYVGIPHAVYMTDHALCLEEYLELLKSYTPDARLTVADRDGYVWSVYYVPAHESGKTEVPVPDGVVYTVSGNNADGFIVTVKAAWDGPLFAEDPPSTPFEEPTEEPGEEPTEEPGEEPAE